MSRSITTTDANFEQTVLQAPGVVVVHFWAPWAGPCKTLTPILEELAGEFADRILIAQINTDEEQAWPSRLGVMAIPTLSFFKDGQEIERMQGAATKSVLRNKFNEILSR
ncbi:MAG: thioredoxin [Caldilineaceae bacterium]